MHDFTFYLGVHQPNWLATMDVPLFVSFTRLRDRDTLWEAKARWAMDSGGFSELKLRGTWTISPMQYASVVRRCVTEIGKLDWAAIQDWMCEPIIRERTGLSVVEHQCLTIRSLLDLRALAPELPWTPVVQGWSWPDYDRHVEMYARHGIDLTREPIVGVGSVCRRQDTLAAGAIFAALRGAGVERLHGFGLKTSGLVDSAPLLTSADSTAWSDQARRSDPLAGHKHGADGKGKCNNCPEYALWWRQQVLSKIDEGMRRDIWDAKDTAWRSNPTSPRLVATVGTTSYYAAKRSGGYVWVDDAGDIVIDSAGDSAAAAERKLRRLIGPYVPDRSITVLELDDLLNNKQRTPQ